MAKRRAGTRKNKTAEAEQQPLLARLLDNSELKARLLRASAIALVVAIAAVGLVIGMRHLKRNVHAMARYDVTLRLEWQNLPDWLQTDANAHILRGIEQRADLHDYDHLLDPRVAQRVGESLTESDIGWVKSVDRVVVRPDGAVAVSCQFRRPKAWVHHGRYCYLSDAEGVRLPGRYDPVDCRDNALMMIEGVESAPPPVGQAWGGVDLTSGLKLADLLVDRPFRNQIESINVANHSGRRDKNRPHIELATDRASSRIWWGRPPGEEFGTEISAAQKLTLLETLYRQWGRIDMNRAYVNIMTWPDRIAMPAQPVRVPRRLLRG